jgi:hypothetical protein
MWLLAILIIGKKHDPKSYPPRNSFYTRFLGGSILYYLGNYNKVKSVKIVIREVISFKSRRDTIVC